MFHPPPHFARPVPGQFARLSETDFPNCLDGLNLTALERHCGSRHVPSLLHFKGRHAKYFSRSARREHASPRDITAATYNGCNPGTVLARIVFAIYRAGCRAMRPLDEAAIYSGLEQLTDLPTPVSSWLIETGLDSTDDPAVWVWAFRDEHEIEFSILHRLRSLIRDTVRKIVGSEEIWVYVRFPYASDRHVFE